MHIRWARYSLMMGLLFLHEAHGAEQNNSRPICGETPRPMRITARHIEPGGVGYNQGYTTLEGFFTLPQTLDKSWVPFLDLRGHVFNNGKLAANAGLGLRWVGSRVYGINSYYDYRQTNHFHYNQFALGLESLGRIWDVRLNGYLPVGKKQSAPFHTRFYNFQNNYMNLSRKREFAMKGANAELGAHIKKLRYASFYAAGGPYYLEGQGKNAWGGEGRIAIDLLDYIRLEGNASYDRIFKGVVQGQLSFIFPFGPRKKIKERKYCHKHLVLRERVLQPVNRDEIIVIDRKRTISKAINPATGQPYFFLFVDNTSHSAGTYESPYNTLIAAQSNSGPNDIIYVFPGDGTSNGMDAGIVLQLGQQFLGSGIDQSIKTTLGTVIIPNQSSTSPTMTSAIGDAITLANNTVVSGFNIASPNGHAIASQSLTTTTIQNNNITNTGADSIFLNGGDLSGTISIQNNFISNGGNVEGIFLTSNDQFLILNITGNTITTGNDSIDVESANTAQFQSTITNNTLVTTVAGNRAMYIGLKDTSSQQMEIMSNTCTGQDGIYVGVKDSGIATGTISGNYLINNTNEGMRLDLSNTGFLNANILNNRFMQNTMQDFHAKAADTSELCVDLIRNTAPALGYFLENGATSILNLTEASNNIGPITESGTISTSPVCP